MICSEGGNCRYSDCPASAHPKRDEACRDGQTCVREGCKFLHPQEWYGDSCPLGTTCPFSDCEKTHPPRAKTCREGLKCSRAKQACGHLHPRKYRRLIR
mmetsp:Transcript_119581/g.381568  ORF Transcript_119581/g.381568 Transcript_119581/m.381568 type:complete len:99 (+) Transcript_119581:594-890(+)